jgi:hypothetical protein
MMMALQYEHAHAWWHGMYYNTGKVTLSKKDILPTLWVWGMEAELSMGLP